MEIDNWHSKRLKELQSENGWLNLAGLFWLKEGINTFGSGDKNDVVFPKGKIPERAGLFVVNQGVVKMEVIPRVNVLIDGRPAASEVIFSSDSASQTKVEYGSLRWFVIKRESIVGIRLRDVDSNDIHKFKGIERYSADPKWRIAAKLEQTKEEKRIDITNVLGQTSQQVLAGTLVFSIDDREYRLDALPDGNELFVIFGDDTNGSETYPSGRYVYANLADRDGKTILDFNKAYNPPCAFTSFATCPLPPSQNILSVAITAGEKKYTGYEHEQH